MRDSLAAFLMSPLMIPHVVLGIAFLRFFSIAGWTGSLGALILVHAIIVSPFSLRMILSSVIGLERDAEHAARSLGASRWVAFRRILLPLILPGVMAGWVLAFIQSFDDVTVTCRSQRQAAKHAEVALYNRVAFLSDPVTTSVSTVMIAGTIVLMFVLIPSRIVGLDRVLLGKN